MEKLKGYIEHPGKAVETGGKFEHVMAIALDPRTGYKEGVIRCITSREGDVATPGYIDRSALYKVRGETLERFSMQDEIVIKNQEDIIKQLSSENSDFIGLEDPDIFIDEQVGLMHLYFTMPFRDVIKDNVVVHLGHAVGKDLDSLEMTMPIL
jgi:hypothetical protein